MFAASDGGVCTLNACLPGSYICFDQGGGSNAYLLRIMFLGELTEPCEFL